MFRSLRMLSLSLFTAVLTLALLGCGSEGVGSSEQAMYLTRWGYYPPPPPDTGTTTVDSATTEPDAGTTPATVRVFADPAALDQGLHAATLIVHTPSPDRTVTIPVELRVGTE